MADPNLLQIVCCFEQRLEKLKVYLQRVAANCGISTQAVAKIQNFTDFQHFSPSVFADVITLIMKTECMTPLSKNELDMRLLLSPALDLYLLLGHKVVDLTAYLSFCPVQLRYQYLKSAVIKISEADPDIEELLLSSKTPRDFRNVDSVVDTEFLQALCKLTKMRVLQLDDWCSFYIEDVFHLCEALPNLQILSINFPDSFDDYHPFNEDKEECAKVLKMSFSNLREFIFTAKQNVSLMNECVKNLPNLQVIYEYNEVFCSKNDYDPSSSNQVASGSSNLRHWMIQLASDDPPENINFKYPHVQHVSIFWYSDFVTDSWENVLQLSKLESVNLYDCPLEVTSQFFDCVGPKLKALNIQVEQDDIEPFLNLNKMFTACPNLEKLRLWLDVSDPEPITSFGRLKEVEVRFIQSNGSKGELVNVLRAPDLEKVTVSGPSLEDLKDLTSLVTKKEILLKLRTLVVELEVNSCAELHDADQFKSIGDFIKSAISSLSSLECVKFYLNSRRSDYCILAKSFRNGITYNEEYMDVTDFFDGLDNKICDTLTEWFVDEELISLLDFYAVESGLLIGDKINYVY